VFMRDNGERRLRKARIGQKTVDRDASLCGSGLLENAFPAVSEASIMGSLAVSIIASCGQRATITVSAVRMLLSFFLVCRPEVRHLWAEGMGASRTWHRICNPC
jgi:hypothetical protein